MNKYEQQIHVHRNRNVYEMLNLSFLHIKRKWVFKDPYITFLSRRY